MNKKLAALTLLPILAFTVAGCKRRATMNLPQENLSHVQQSARPETLCLNHQIDDYEPCEAQGGYAAPQHVYVPHPMSTYHGVTPHVGNAVVAAPRVYNRPRIITRPVYRVVTPRTVYSSRPTFRSSSSFRSSGFRTSSVRVGR
jgi:hypothetical protein